MIPSRLKRKKDLSKTVGVLAIIFSKIRKAPYQPFLPQDLLNNDERFKYSEEATPRVVDIENHKDYIIGHVPIYDNHKTIEGSGENERPVEPIGWIEDVFLSYTPDHCDNPTWYCGLIAKLRLYKDKVRDILFKYKQGSLYALKFSISFSPLIEYGTVDGKEVGRVTDITFREVSITNDPAFYRCRPLQLFNKKFGITNKDEKNSTGIFKKKKYIITTGFKTQKVFHAYEMSKNGEEVRIPNPAQTVDKNISFNKTPKEKNDPKPKQQNEVVVDQQIQKVEYTKEKFGFNYNDLLKNKDDAKYLSNVLKNIVPILNNYMNSDVLNLDTFIKKIDGTIDKHVNNFRQTMKLLKKPLTNESEKLITELLYTKRFHEVMNPLLALQDNYIKNEMEKEKKNKIAQVNFQKNTNEFTKNHQQQQRRYPQQHQAGLPMTNGALQPTSKLVYRTNIYSKSTTPDFGSQSWKRSVATGNKFKNRVFDY